MTLSAGTKSLTEARDDLREWITDTLVSFFIVMVFLELGITVLLYFLPDFIWGRTSTKNELERHCAGKSVSVGGEKEAARGQEMK